MFILYFNNNHLVPFDQQIIRGKSILNYAQHDVSTYIAKTRLALIYHPEELYFGSKSGLNNFNICMHLFLCI